MSAVGLQQGITGTMNKDALEQLEGGIEREWTYNGRIAVLKVPTIMPKATVDHWAHRVMDTIGRFPNDQPVCILHDLSALTQGFSSYGRSWSDELYRRLPSEREMYGAYVVPDGLVNRLIQHFIRPRLFHLPNYTERVFTERDHALAWLRKQCG